MFTQLMNSIPAVLNQHLEGWQVLTFKFWVNESGVEYCEAKIKVADDVLFFRLKGEGDSIRLVDVELQKPQLSGRKMTSHGKPRARSEGS